MHVEGSLEEIAAQQGAFAAASPAGTHFVDAFANAVSAFISGSSTLRKIPFMRTIAKWVYDLAVRDPLVRAIPKPERAAYKAYARGMNYSEGKLLDAAVVSDSSLVLQEFMQKTGILPRLKTLSCTSIFWDAPDGSTFYARNLDSEEIGFWDKGQVIIHSVPSDGLASVSLSAFGFPTIGITGFNETGLTLDLHQLNEYGTSAHGVPVLVIADRILRQAHSIDEAVAIIQGFKKRAGPWAFILSQNGEKAVVETTSKDFFVRRSHDPYFYVGSHAQGEDLKRDEAWFLTSDMLDSLERIDRLETYGRAFATSHEASAPLIGQLISDRPRVGAGTVARLDAVESIVMDVAHRRVWVGVGNASLAPNEGTYAGLEWDDLRSSARPRAIEGFTVDAGHSDSDRALRSLLRQVQVADTLDDQDRIFQLLTQYVQIVRQTPRLDRGAWSGLYLYIGTALARIQGPAGFDLNELSSLLDLALSDADLHEDTRWSRYRLDLGLLYRARLHDLQGLRAQALAEYADLLKLPLEKNLITAAQANLKKAYSKDDAASIDISYSMVDLIL
jgi:hypothetical protein